MQMGQTRLTSLSIMFYLKDNIYDDVENEILEPITNKTYQIEDVPLVVSRPVVIKINEAIVEEGYSVNYDTGVITFSEAISEEDVVKASYSYNWIDIVDAWPIHELTKPTISVESGPYVGRPFQLGGGEWIQRLYRINVFSDYETMRDDITDMIRNLFKADIPLIDYNNGFPINDDGTKNEEFDASTQKTGTIMVDRVPVTPNPVGTMDGRGRSLIEVRISTVEF